MEQIFIFVVLIVASLISSAIQNRKKRDTPDGAPPGRPRAPQRWPRTAPGETAAGKDSPGQPQTRQRWPRTAAEWQEQLRRMIEEQAGIPPAPRPIPSVPAPTPPPVIAPVTQRRQIQAAAETAEGDLDLPSRLRDSAAAFQRASGLHDRVGERMRAIDRRTDSHRPDRIAARSARSARPPAHWIRDPRRVREAFVASLIFSPPVAFQSPEETRAL